MAVPRQILQSNVNPRTRDAWWLIISSLPTHFIRLVWYAQERHIIILLVSWPSIRGFTFLAYLENLVCHHFTIHYPFVCWFLHELFVLSYGNEGNQQTDNEWE